LLPWFISVHNSSIQNPTINITCLEPDRSEETSELPTTKGGNQVPDTYNATSAPTRLIPAQPTSTTSLLTWFEQYTENTQSQPDSKGTKCDHRKISCKNKTKYTETGFIILVIYAGSYKALLDVENWSYLQIQITPLVSSNSSYILH
jgi:hypothetical protein